MREALEESRAHYLTCAQCALGSLARKYTTLAFSPGLEAHVRRLREARCTHGVDGHPAVAHGRDEHGAARAAATAAYPAGMNEAIADALISGVEGVESARQTRATAEVVGGRVADGPRLTPSIRARVEAARETPP
eukprot:6205870-Pleurochrysis_carterae.AAC.1